MNLYFKIKDENNKGSINILNDDGTYLIYGLKVSKFYRNEGLGSHLLKLAERTIKKLGYKEIFLYVIQNSWMHNWYKKCGYVDTNDICEENYVKMKKKLE